MYNCGICGGEVELLGAGQTLVNHRPPCVVELRQLAKGK